MFAVLSCSADKCKKCNVNDVENVATGLCPACEESHRCNYCGTISEVDCMPNAMYGKLCPQCESKICSRCRVIYEGGLMYNATLGKLCPQCKAQQDPFGM